MEPLSKEYFEQVIGTLATKDDIRSLQINTNNRIDALQSEMNTRFDALQSEMNIKFDAVLELLDVRQTVETLEQQMREVRRELNLT